MVPQGGGESAVHHPSMRPVLLVVAVVVLAGCPKRREPERGHELVFSKRGEVRRSVERRLAQLDVRARLSEDGDQLSVRLPDTGSPIDVEAVKALLSVPAKLEFCKEAAQPAGAGCQAPQLEDGGVAGPVVEREPDDFDSSRCMAVGPDAKELRAAMDAGIGRQVMAGAKSGGGWRTYVSETGCLEPRVLDAKASKSEGLGAWSVNVTFDGPTATRFSELTASMVNQRLFIVLDGVVTSAPVVREAITGGRAMVTLGANTDEATARKLAAAFKGGPIEGGLTLTREGPYGPPRLGP
jgi:preprotein translocase subunit SecD